MNIVKSRRIYVDLEQSKDENSLVHTLLPTESRAKKKRYNSITSKNSHEEQISLKRIYSTSTDRNTSSGKKDMLEINGLTRNNFELFINYSRGLILFSMSCN